MGNDVGPEVAVVMPTHDRSALLPVALEHVLTQEGCRFEVVVVDDASTDDTPAVLDRFVASGGGRLRALAMEENGGPAVARNRAWRTASTEWIAFTDDDCEPQPGWLAALLATAHTEGADLVQGRTSPNPAHRAGGCWARSVSVQRFNHRYQTCNLLVRRSLLEELGGFDEDFPFAGEDADLGWRATKAGATTAFAPDADVHHAVREVPFRQHLRDRAVWADLVRVVKHHPEARMLVFRRYFYRRSHVLVLAGTPALAALGVLRWWAPPVVLGAGVVARAARADDDAGPVERLRCAAEATVAAVWETVQFARASARHRTLLL